jgi:hypothetical protein
MFDRNAGDLRVQKTLDNIHSTFEELMVEMPFESITVTALCARARINKKTFYRYYPTLNDLLDEYEDRYAREYIELTSGMRYPEDLEQVTGDFLRFSAAQGPMYDAILCNEKHGRIFAKIAKGMESERYANSVPPEGWTAEEWHLYMVGVTAVQWQTYRKWVKDGKIVPLERLVEIACTILVKGGLLK